MKVSQTTVNDLEEIHKVILHLSKQHSLSLALTTSFDARNNNCTKNMQLRCTVLH